jgi:hypothetical protein
METAQRPHRWVIVDFFGHQRFAGRVTEVQQFGATMGRLEVPEVDARPGFVKDFSGGSVFSMTDVTEEVAIAFTRAARPAPVQRYELAMLPAVETPPDAEEVDEAATCEGEACSRPATTRDIDGVPLCDKCHDEADQAAAVR